MLIVKAVLFITLFKCSYGLQCVDHNKNPVDWYVVYKLPQHSGPNSLLEQGAAYTFLTSNVQDDWQLSDISINSTQSLIALNLQTLFDDTTEKFYILYNDEQPDGSVNFHKGHSKGVLLGNKDGGFWLVHSVPHFPSIEMGSYFYPHSGFIYGQSFLCVSLNADNLNKLGDSLKYNLPNIYSHLMPTSLKSVFPKLTDLINNITPTSAPWYYMQMLKSVGGQMFFAFAKGPKFAKELYGDWVAPSLNTDLFTETWLNGPGALPSKCNLPFQVNNIKSVFIDVANYTFKDSNDHSKWAVSSLADKGTKWLCIGDINRAMGQKRRGGGTLCFSAVNIVNVYQKSIADVEAC